MKAQGKQIPKVSDKDLRIIENEIDGKNVLDDDKINISNILQYEFYCPICDDLDVPEILTIDSENNEIKLNCRKRGEKEVYDMKNYFKKIKEGEYNKDTCQNEKCGSSINLKQRKTCLNCKIILCEKCVNNHDGKHLIVPRNEISSFCSLHKKETTKYCNDCETYVCSKCFSAFHNRHDNDSKKLIENTQKARDIILKKDQKLSKMKQFYEMVRLAYKNNNNNVMYIQNMINVYKSIKKEQEKKDKFKEYYLDLAIYKKEKEKQKEKENKNNKIEIKT